MRRPDVSRPALTRYSVHGLIVFAVCACGADPAPDEVDSASSAILNGTKIPPENSGVVRIDFPTPTGSSWCSGTLLKNQWVLTAAHCVDLFLDRDYPAAPRGLFLGASGTIVRAAKVDAGGRLVIAGASSGRFHLRRFTAAGAVDTSFGAAGIVETDLSPGSDVIEDIAFQADGRIVAVGSATSNGQPVFALVRYEASGAVDTSFGFLGGMLTDFGSGPDEALGVALDSSGRAVVAGTTNDAGVGYLALARYSTNGILDATFDGDGKVQTGLGAQTLAARANDIVIDGSGRIVVAGLKVESAGFNGISARYLPSGALDATFASGGIITGPPGSGANAVRLQGDRVVVGGSSNNVATVWRFTSTGAVDPTFGFVGAAQPAFIDQKTTQVVGMAVTPDGRLRVAVDYQDTGGGVYPGLATASGSGVFAPDRVLPETTGTVLPAFAGTTAAAIALHGDRVFVAGNAGGPSESVLVTKPDRTVDEGLADPTFTARISMGAERDIVADRAYLAPGTTDDVALLHLQRGVLMNGSQTGFTFAGFHPSPASLTGRDLTCKGYGFDQLDLATLTQSGGGVLETGLSRVVGLLDPYLLLGFLPAPAVPQIPLSGDSGASCTLDGKIVGVMSRRVVITAGIVNASRFATWATWISATP